MHEQEPLEHHGQMSLTHRHQRYALAALLVFVLAFQWLRAGSYSVDEHYVVYRPPVTQSDESQGIRAKPRDSGRRARATLVMLCESGQMYDVVATVKSVEDRFNSKYHYDWVFIGNGVLTTEFRTVTANLVSGQAQYGYVARDEWSFPRFVDAEQSYQDRLRMAGEGLPRATDLEYRHRQRYLAGFLANHTLLHGYDFFWRVDPGVTLSCDVNYDVFQLMGQNGRKYGFSVSRRGNDRTNPGLFPAAHAYFEANKDRSVEGNNAKFVDLDERLDVSYQGHCEFFTEWEIADLNFLRSEPYADLFNHLDHTGGFYHEAWSASAVRSVMASMLLRVDELHWFSDVGVSTEELTACPLEKEVRTANKCTCDPSRSVTWNPKKYCTHKYFLVNKLERPDGWREQINRNL